MNADDPYVAPEAPLAPTPAAPPAPAGALGGGPAAFVLLAAMLAGACVFQASSILLALALGRAPVPAALRDVVAFWAILNLGAAIAGILGAHAAIRRGSAARPAILAFLLLYCLVIRVGGVSFGWPFQFHVGFGIGSGAAGLNLLGAGLACWWLRLRLRERPQPARIEPPEST